MNDKKDPAVTTLLNGLDHPLKSELETVRGLILGASPQITEAVKWNAPSYRTTDFFATVNLRSKKGVELVFHTGAKVKKNGAADLQIPDPTNLVKWLAKDRCLVTLGAGKELRARKAAFVSLVQEWIRHLPAEPEATGTRKKVERPAGSSDQKVEEVLTWLRAHATKATLKGMARYAIPSDRAFGVSMKDMKVLGKKLGRDQTLASALWDTGWYEARMLTAFVGDPARITATEMDRWCKDFDNWAYCDTLCFNLFDRTPHAWKKVAEWSRKKGEFEKRTAFALLWSLALHDKAAKDESFVRGLVLIEQAASDERNFVKKAVNMALKAIGKRNASLNAAALDVARRLGDSGEPTAAWIGRDALRELSKARKTR